MAPAQVEEEPPPEDTGKEFEFLSLLFAEGFGVRRRIAALQSLRQKELLF